MKGLLAHTSPLMQLLTLFCIASVSFFIFGLLGVIVLQVITGHSLDAISNLTPSSVTKPGVLTFLRGMQLVQFIGLFLLPAWICARLFSYEPNRFLGLRAPNLKSFWFWSILIMLISIPFIQFIGELNQRVIFPGILQDWFKAQEKAAEDTVKALLSINTPQELLLNIIFIAALAGIGEELLFRGLIQRLLGRQFGTWFGIVVAAALFSGMHLQFFGFFPRFLLGIALGILYAYSGSLWVAILAHFFYDALLIIAAYAYPSLLEKESTLPILQTIPLALISLALSLLLIFYMIRRSKEVPPEEVIFSTEDRRNPFSS